MTNTTEILKQHAIQMGEQDLQEDDDERMLIDAKKIKSQENFVRFCQDWGWDAEACELFMRETCGIHKITTRARLMLEDEGAEGGWDS